MSEIEKNLKIATIVTVIIMALFTVYDIMMVDKIMPITGMFWTRAECAISVVAGWLTFAILWPTALATLIDEKSIEEMTK